MCPSIGGSAGLSEEENIARKRSSRGGKASDPGRPTKPKPKPNPPAISQPEAAPQLATPLETALANARAFEALVGKMERELNEARIKLLKWQGAAEFQASLEKPEAPPPPEGSGNGKDTIDPLDGKEPKS